MKTPVDKIVSGLKQKDRTLLAQAITLIESDRVQDQASIKQILNECWKYDDQSIVIGVSGPPGAGKSTLINQWGKYLLEHQKKSLAVLTIDPSSAITGGSILGDKTRMHDLAYHPQGFVRPSPSLNYLGGVNPATREVILLLKTFGFDYIIVESVGVGQSESELASMVDAFWLLVAPGQGDDLQGIKRGVLELADLMIINKSDQAKDLAEQTRLHYQGSAALNQGAKSAEVLKISSLSEQGITPLCEYFQKQTLLENSSQGLSQRQALRQQQSLTWARKRAERILWQKLNEVWESSSPESQTASPKKINPIEFADQFLQQHFSIKK